MLLTAATAGRDFSIVGLFMHADPIVKSIMLGLVVCSLACWAIIVEKLVRMRRLAAETNEIETASEGARLPAAARGAGLAAAVSRAAEAEWGPGPAAGESREETRGRLEAAMRMAMKSELKRNEVGLPFLATVGSAAPFIGLFGTVWGIMNSFTAIAQAKDTSLAVVAPGIAEALFATAIGLAAAIPAVIAYNQFTVSLGRIADRAGPALGRLARNISRGSAAGQKG